MYNKDFLTTYTLIDDYEISFPLYQSQLLQIFNIEEFDEIKILNEFKNIESEICYNLDFLKIKKNLLEKFKNSIFNEDNIIMLLLSFEYFDNFHKCYIKNDFSKFNI